MKPSCGSYDIKDENEFFIRYDELTGHRPKYCRECIMSINRIEDDFEQLKRITAEAFLTPDIHTLGGIMQYVTVPILGPSGVADRVQPTHGPGGSGPPFYNPYKGYIRGLFLIDHSTDASYSDDTNRGLIPVESIEFPTYSPVNLDFVEGHNLTEIKCKKCGAFAELPFLTAANITWGKFLAFDGSQRRVYGHIYLTLRSRSGNDACEINHLQWGFVTLASTIEA